MTTEQKFNPMEGSPERFPSVRRSVEAERAQILHDYRKTKKPELLEQIVSQYSNLVESVARRFTGSAEPFEDLAQEGYIGLLNAVDLYDPNKNVKFPTYATHFIIGQIRHYLRDKGKIIKEPAWMQEQNQRISRAIEALTQQLGKTPSNLQIARSLNMTEEAVTEMMATREIFKVSSIDGNIDREDENGDALDVERMDVAVPFQLPIEDRIVLDSALGQLKDLEQRVIQDFYFNDLTQTEIAKRLGISCNYVSHILRNSTKKLKKFLTNDELRDARRKIDQMQRQLSEQESFIEQNLLVDPLTRLYNRKYFEERVEEEITRASRHKYEVALVCVRAAHLKEFAHAHGTLKADAALLKFSEAIQGSIRRVDILTRYDQDRFALILPYTGHNAHIVCKRLGVLLHTLLSENNWNQGRSGIEAQFGSALYPHDSIEIPVLLAQATQKLSSFSALTRHAA